MRPHLVSWLNGLAGGGAGELLAPNYVVMLCFAILAGSALALRVGTEHGFDMRRGLLALLLAYPGALLGARLLTVFTKIPDALVAGDPGLLWRGGLAAYGGFLGGIFAVWLGLGRRDLLAFGDVTAATLGLGTFVTRLGCFLAGCDYGTVTSVPWAVRFPAGSQAFDAHLASGWVGPLSGGSLAVHPTELYEAALGLAICAGALLWMRARRGRPLDGRVFLAAIATYAAGRFGIEAFRGDVDRGVWLGVFSTSQLVSLGVALLAATVAFRRFVLGRGLPPTGGAPDPAAPPSTPGHAPSDLAPRPRPAPIAAAALPALIAVSIAAVSLLSPRPASAAAGPAAPPTVAVIDRAPATAPGAGIRTALIDLVAGAIGTGRVLAPITVRALLEDKGIVPEKVVDPVSWAAVARLLKVDLAIGISATLDDTSAGFEATVYDKSGKTRWIVNEPCPRCTPVQLEDAARNLASRLADAIVGKTPAGPGGYHGEEPGTGPPPATAPAGEGFKDVPRDPFGGTPESATTVPFAPEGAVAASVPFPEARKIAVRLGVGPSFVIARKTVPTLGYAFLVEGSYTLKNRTELGLQFVYFIDGDSKHFTFAGTFEWKIGKARRGALYAGGSLGVTHVVFDDAPKSVTAFDTRARFGWEALFGKVFGLRLEFLNLSFKMSGAFGIIPAWEPRVMLSLRF